MDAVGVKLADGGSDALEAREVSLGELVSGTKDEPGFLEIWVYSSVVSAGSGAEGARMRGKVSCRGRSNDVNLKTDVRGDCSGIDAECRSAAIGAKLGWRIAVVSSTAGGEELPGLLRYARTASRICSSAADKS